SMYPTSILLVGERATRSRFIESAESCRLIHYAGHAESGAASSYASLRLAGDGARNSGELDAGQIAHLHLRQSPLVVLAAWGTIRGETSHIEGMGSVEIGRAHV